MVVTTSCYVLLATLARGGMRARQLLFEIPKSMRIYVNIFCLSSVIELFNPYPSEKVRNYLVNV